MICNNCGSYVNDGTLFCPSCGAQVSAPAPQQPTYQPPYQPGGYQGGYQQPGYAVKPKVPGRGFGISALVLGIIGLIYSFIALVGAAGIAELLKYTYGSYRDEAIAAAIGEILVWAVLPLLATIFGFLARKRGYQNGVSMSGLVMGIIGLALCLISIFVISGAA